MAALDPAVAAIRGAVRRCPLPEPGAPVLVACSGGPDSMALAAAARFALPRAGLVTVDHQLQAGSGESARRVGDWANVQGFNPVVVTAVDTTDRPGGPEAAARDARYEALAMAAREHGAAAVLLGHTRDDQAETVLLALVRGAGPRGLAGMPVRRRRHGVLFVRPLLDVSRAQTRAACLAEDLPTWEDPHNSDPSYRRTHARALLASLVDRLGPAVVANLARTARLAAADADALDRWAARAAARVGDSDGGLAVAALASLPDAVRTRVLHKWAGELGAPGSALSHRHVAALDALVTAWRGQGPVSLPGGIVVVRRAGHLVRTDAPPGSAPTDIPRASRPVAVDEAGLPHG
jgi:tRNA(Ile)-lysidine synthase